MRVSKQLHQTLSTNQKFTVSKNFEEWLHVGMSFDDAIALNLLKLGRHYLEFFPDVVFIALGPIRSIITKYI